MASKKRLTSTVALWRTAVERELAEGLDPDIALAACYAQLALDGTVTLTASGHEKIETAHKRLSDLVGGSS